MPRKRILTHRKYKLIITVFYYLEARILLMEKDLAHKTIYLSVMENVSKDEIFDFVDHCLCSNFKNVKNPGEKSLLKDLSFLDDLRNHSKGFDRKQHPKDQDYRIAPILSECNSAKSYLNEAKTSGFMFLPDGRVTSIEASVHKDGTVSPANYSKFATFMEEDTDEIPLNEPQSNRSVRSVSSDKDSITDAIDDLINAFSFNERIRDIIRTYAFALRPLKKSQIISQISTFREGLILSSFISRYNKLLRKYLGNGFGVYAPYSGSIKNKEEQSFCDNNTRENKVVVRAKEKGNCDFVNISVPPFGNFEIVSRSEQNNKSSGLEFNEWVSGNYIRKGPKPKYGYARDYFGRIQERDHYLEGENVNPYDSNSNYDSEDDHDSFYYSEGFD